MQQLAKPVLFVMPPHTEGEGISESTPVKLGLIIVIFGGLIGVLTGVGTSIWWASGTTAKLDHITFTLQSIPTQIETLKEDMRVLQSAGSPGFQALKTQVIENQERLRVIETQGSPAVISRLNKLDEEISKLREEFEIHKASAKP